MSSKQNVIRQSSIRGLRYHIPNRDKYREKYAHPLLFMFHPFRSESELLADDGSYMTKLATQEIHNVPHNRQHFEPCNEIGEAAFRDFQTNRPDMFSQQEGDEINKLAQCSSDNDCTGENTETTIANEVHLIQTIYSALNKLLSYSTNTLEKERVLLLAPTGIAAVNIAGSTIHSALKIPLHDFGKNVSRLSDSNRSALRQLLSDISLSIIDEVSMVSNVFLSYIHQRIVELYGCSSDVPVANKSVIADGDFINFLQ